MTDFEEIQLKLADRCFKPELLPSNKVSGKFSFNIQGAAPVIHCYVITSALEYLLLLITSINADSIVNLRI